MKRTIVVYGQDIGGARIVALAVRELMKLYPDCYRYRIVAHANGGQAFEEQGLPYQDLSSFGYQLPLDLENAVKLLRQLKADYLFGGIGNVQLDTSNGALFKAAKKLSIKSVAPLDCWQGWDRYHAGENRFDWAPDLLVVIDEFSRKKMIKEGFPNDKIIVGGHPLLYYFFQKRKAAYLESISNSKKRKAINGDGSGSLVFVLVGQMVIHRTRGSVIRESLFLLDTPNGKMLDVLINGIKQFSKISSRKIDLLIRLHPKEKCSSEIVKISSLSDSTVSVRIDENSSRELLYSTADLIIGYDSMMLAEAACFGVPVISFDFNWIDNILGRNRIDKLRAGNLTILPGNLLASFPLYINFALRKDSQSESYYKIDLKKPSYIEILRDALQSKREGK